MQSLGKLLEKGVITFPEGVPGLTQSTRFVIVRPGDLEPILLLESVEDARISLPVVPVHTITEGYELRLTGSDRRLLGMGPEADCSKLLCLAVLILPGKRRPAACNLFAPIVINPATRLAKQVVQLESDYPTLHPLGGG